MEKELTDNQLQYAHDRAKLIIEHWWNGLQEYYVSEIRMHRERGHAFDKEVLKWIDGK